ncbi:MAG: restriction endonuclease subunit S, partial [Rhodothermales bacterium]
MNTSRFDSWIHDSFRTSAEGLALYRIFFAAFTLIVVAPGHDLYTDIRQLASLPSTMFAPPPGPMMLFRGFPSALMGEVLLGALNFGLVAVLFGYRTPLFSFGT